MDPAREAGGVDRYADILPVVCTGSTGIRKHSPPLGDLTARSACNLWLAETGIPTTSEGSTGVPTPPEGGFSLPTAWQASARLPTAWQARSPLRLLLPLLLLALTQCKVTSDDIDTWKGTVKGPGKMVAVMLAEKYDMTLRTDAALALVEMERQDVDGVAELQRAIQKLGGPARKAIIDGLTPGILVMMNEAPQGSDPALSGPTPRQTRAKDAAFLLIPNAEAEKRTQLTKAVVGWYVEDFNRRNLAGNFSAEQVVRALGAPAARQLVDALNARLPQQALIKLSELIGQLGAPDAKSDAGRKLVAIEQEMASAGFRDWLVEQINTQMRARGGKIDAARVQKAAQLNQANFIANAAVPAMKYLADQPAVAERLLTIAENHQGATTDLRAKALMALEGKATPEQLDRLLALALDNRNPARVRDYAFDRVGDIRSARALPPMWPLVQDAKNQRLRWRAGELVLAIGGNGVLKEFFAKLPSGNGVSYEPEELEGYATRMGQMTPHPTELLHKQLESQDWWAQVIALKYFERKGALADIPAMEALQASRSSVSGEHWGSIGTVGEVAEKAIAGLRERVKQASAGAVKGEAS